MIYREDVIIFYKAYQSKMKSVSKIGYKPLNREELLKRICKGIGVSTTYENKEKIRGILREEFGRPTPLNKTPKTKEQRIIKLYEEGMTIKKIMELTQVAPNTLYRILDKNNVKKRGRVKKTNTERVLSDEIVNKIRKTIKIENISRGLKG